MAGVQEKVLRTNLLFHQVEWLVVEPAPAWGLVLVLAPVLVLGLVQVLALVLVPAWVLVWALALAVVLAPVLVLALLLVWVLALVQVSVAVSVLALVPAWVLGLVLVSVRVSELVWAAVSALVWVLVLAPVLELVLAPVLELELALALELELGVGHRASGCLKYHTTHQWTTCELHMSCRLCLHLNVLHHMCLASILACCTTRPWGTQRTEICSTPLWWGKLAVVVAEVALEAAEVALEDQYSQTDVFSFWMRTYSHNAICHRLARLSRPSTTTPSACDAQTSPNPNSSKKIHAQCKGRGPKDYKLH